MATLRHIRPHSMDWDEAMMEEDGSMERLEPEQLTRLRNLLEAERALGMPPVGPKRAELRVAPR